jgi:cell division protein FtsZ
MQAKGMAIMGSGMADGENRAIEAATQAISSPLLENICIDGATGIIINVTGGPDLTLWEVNEASTLITEAAHPDAEIIFGAVIDETMGDKVSVTVIATGFGAGAQKTASDNLNRIQALHESQLMDAGMQRLTQTMNVPPPPAPETYAATASQTFETINLSLDARIPETPMPAAPAHHAAPNPSQHVPPTAPQMSFSTKSPGPQMRTGNLPREALLAKARAYRESQAHRDSSQQPEQLSLNMDEPAPMRLTPEPSRSPFSTSGPAGNSGGESLEVPSYLRRKRGLGADNNEGLE